MKEKIFVLTAGPSGSTGRTDISTRFACFLSTLKYVTRKYKISHVQNQAEGGTDQVGVRFLYRPLEGTTTKCLTFTKH